MEKLDDIDVKMIKILLKDSRKKFTDIAKECGVSVTTIKNHYSELKKSGIIAGSTVMVNARKMGYEGHLSLYVNTKFDEVEQFLEYANKLPRAIPSHVTLNENFNVHILIQVKSFQEIEKRKQEVKNHPSVIDVKANIWTEIISIPENFSLDNLKNG